MSEYEIVIWLEIHLKVNAEKKLFCSCRNVQEFDDLESNTHICPVCTWQPWALPVLDQWCLEKAVLLWLSLNCHINERSVFDRKSYFYPDLPMWYQITQQYTPTCVDGEVTWFVDNEFTEEKSVRIRDAHIETDTGKSVREWNIVSLDYNRAGTPLVEIVTHPDFRSGDEVVSFLKELQRRARFQWVSDAEMESGQMRVDVNISLRKHWDTSFNPRVELKNMNSFSAVQRAIESEYARQAALYDNNGQPDQETRWRDDQSKTSYVMRSKEDAMDYRYMPEPDLPVLDLDLSWVDTMRAQRVQTPHERMVRYKETYGFNKEFINGLIGDVEVNQWFENAVNEWHDPKETAKWLVWPILREMNETQFVLSDLKITYEHFEQFLSLIQDGKLISSHAKIVMWEMIKYGTAPQSVIDEKWLKPVGEGDIKAWIEEVFAEKPELKEDIAAWNMKPLGFIIWQVVKKSQGSADPKMVKELIIKN